MSKTITDRASAHGAVALPVAAFAARASAAPAAR